MENIDFSPENDDGLRISRIQQIGRMTELANQLAPKNPAENQPGSLGKDNPTSPEKFDPILRKYQSEIATNGKIVSPVDHSATDAWNDENYEKTLHGKRSRNR